MRPLILPFLCLCCFAPAALGQEKPAGEAAGKRDLLLILDCSGSMLGTTADGEVKLVPVVAADKPRLTAAVQGFQGCGRTPIAASLVKAKEILTALGTDREKSLVPVTDGIETCGGNTQAAAAALLSLGIKLDFLVVGFDLTEEEARATKKIAEAEHGIEDEVRIVDTKPGVEVARFSAFTLDRSGWKNPVVIPVMPGCYTLEWRRKGADRWFRIVKDFDFDGNSLIDVKF